MSLTVSPDISFINYNAQNLDSFFIMEKCFTQAIRDLTGYRAPYFSKGINIAIEVVVGHGQCCTLRLEINYFMKKLGSFWSGISYWMISYLTLVYIVCFYILVFPVMYSYTVSCERYVDKQKLIPN